MSSDSGLATGGSSPVNLIHSSDQGVESYSSSLEDIPAILANLPPPQPQAGGHPDPPQIHLPVPNTPSPPPQEPQQQLLPLPPPPPPPREMESDFGSSPFHVSPSISPCSLPSMSDTESLSPFNVSDTDTSKDLFSSPDSPDPPRKKRKKRVISSAKKSGGRVRRKQSCHVCGKQVVHMLRHLRQVHEKDKKKPASPIKSKTGYLYKACPLPKCGKLISRLSQHLASFHKIQDKDERQRWIQQAIVLQKPSTRSPRRALRSLSKSPRKSPRKGPRKIWPPPGMKRSCMELFVGSSGDEATAPPKKRRRPSNGPQPPVDTPAPQEGDPQPQADTPAPQEGDPQSQVDTPAPQEGDPQPQVDTPAPQKGDPQPQVENPAPQEGDPQPQVDETGEKESALPTNFLTVPDIGKFIGWMQGPDGGKDTKTALQHGKQLFSIWTEVRTGSKFNSEDLLNIVAVRDKWLADFTQVWAPGTTRSYLGSLRLYLRFLDLEGLTERHQDVAAALGRIQNLQKIVQKKAKKRQTEVDVQTLGSLVTPAEVQDFLQSKITKEIEKMLESPLLRPDFKDVFCGIRDYLMLRILLSNGQRSGVLISLTPDAISRAEITSNGAVVSVAKHKTDYISPANVALPEPIWGYLKKYMTMLRRLPKYETLEMNKKSIFVSYPRPNQTPQVMNQSSINKALNRLWVGKYGSSKCISATKIRKAVVTNVRRAVPQAREVLARHMCHRPATADRFYDLQTGRDHALPVSQMITATMTKASATVTSQEQEPTPAPTVAVVPPSIQETSAEQDTQQDTLPRTRQLISIPDYDAPEATTSTDLVPYVPQQQESPTERSPTLRSQPQSPSKSPKIPTEETATTDAAPDMPPSVMDHKRRSFTPEESSALLRLCSPLIRENKVKIGDVISLLQSSDEGLALLLRLKTRLGTGFRKKIYDRVRCELRKKKKQ